MTCNNVRGKDVTSQALGLRLRQAALLARCSIHPRAYPVANTAPEKQPVSRSDVANGKEDLSDFTGQRIITYKRTGVKFLCQKCDGINRHRAASTRNQCAGLVVQAHVALLASMR